MIKTIKYLACLCLSTSVLASNSDPEVWSGQPSAEEVYKSYIGYMSESAKNGIVYNERIGESLSFMYGRKNDDLGNPTEEPKTAKTPEDILADLQVVAAHQGEYYPLDSWSKYSYCQRATFQNMRNVFFQFIFAQNVPPRVLGLVESKGTVGKKLMLPTAMWCHIHSARRRNWQGPWG